MTDEGGAVPAHVLRALVSVSEDAAQFALLLPLCQGDRILASGRVTRERGSRTGLRWRELAVDALRGKSLEWHAVAHALGNAGGRFALAWKARPTLARAAGVSEDTVSRVVRALEDVAPITSELWLVSHRDVRTNRRVRTVFDFLVAELS